MGKTTSEIILSVITKLAGLEHKYVKLSNGVKMHYVQSKNESTEYVVCVHGFAGSWHHWLYLAQLFNSHYNLILVDLSGFGQSSINWQMNYSIPNQSELLAEFLNEINVQNYHLVGNSMGGWICQYHTITHPQQVKSLTLVNSAGVRAKDSELYKEFDDRNNPLLFKDPSKFSTLMYWFFESKPFLYDLVKPYFIHLHIKRYDQYKKIFNDFWYNEPALHVEQIKCPTLIVWGKEDKCVDISVADKTYSLLNTEKQFQFIEHSGHLPMIERPIATAEVINSFFKKLLNK